MKLLIVALTDVEISSIHQPGDSNWNKPIHFLESEWDSKLHSYSNAQYSNPDANNDNLATGTQLQNSNSFQSVCVRLVKKQHNLNQNEVKVN